MTESRELLITLAASVAVEKFKRGEKDAAYEAVAEYMAGDDARDLFRILEHFPALRADLGQRS